MSKRTLGFSVVVVIVALVMWTAFDQPGPDDLDVQFVELDLARNENNTGPVKRRYLVSISDTIWSDLEQYGNMMPYAKLGTTEVYFFLQGSLIPETIQLSDPPYSSAFDQALIAIYEKGTMGRVALKKFPNQK